jgi:RND family efflux transporter MFP subunit
MFNKKFIKPDSLELEEVKINNRPKFFEFLKNRKFLILLFLLPILIFISIYYYQIYLKNIPEVKTIPVIRSSLILSISCNGIIIAKEQYSVSSKLGGTIKNIYIKDGDKVKEGDLLLEIDDAQIKSQILQLETSTTSAKANLQNAKIALEEAERNLKISEELFKAKAISYEQVELAKTQLKKAKAGYLTADAQLKSAIANLNQTQEQLKEVKIYAPCDGIVSFSQSPTSFLSTNTLQIGSFISPNTPILNIINPDALSVKGYVDEVNIKDIRVGSEVEIKSETYPDKTFRGVVSKIGKDIINQGGLPTVEVLIDILDKDIGLKIGSSVDVDIITKYKKNALIIPNNAIINKDGENYVYVVKRASKPRVNLRRINTGIIADNNVEVLSGLIEGEEVVIEGQNKLKDNLRIRWKKQ